MSTESDFPIFVLHDVSLFDRASDELVPLTRLLELRPEYGMKAGEFYAMGSAIPWLVDKVESDDEEDEEDFEDFRIDGGDEEEWDRMSTSSDVESTSTSIKTSTLVNITFYDYPDSKKMDRWVLPGPWFCCHFCTHGMYIGIFISRLREPGSSSANLRDTTKNILSHFGLKYIYFILQLQQLCEIYGSLTMNLSITLTDCHFLEKTLSSRQKFY